MANALQQAGALAEPSNFAPLHTNRIFTGLWTNRNFLRDAATTDYQEKYGMGRQDSILDGYNSEISPRLTLKRRAGSSVYNSNTIAPVNRFYSFNTFNLTDEFIRVLADTKTDVMDITLEADGTNTYHSIWHKGAGAQKTFFLGVGNTLYFTNGVENKQITYDPDTKTWGTAQNWGIQPPANAPIVTQALRPNPYGSWLPNTGYTILGPRSVTILDNFANWQQMVTVGLTGNTIPSWSPAVGGITQDNQVQWKNIGGQSWQANHAYNVGDPMRGAVDPNDPSITNLFWCIQAGTSGAGTPGWIPGLGNHVSDGGVVWENGGVTQTWSQQVSVNYINQDTIVDPHGYIQKAKQYGRTNATPPNFPSQLGASVQDSTVLWQNSGAFSVPGTAPIQYGYAYKNSATSDVSNMSPASPALTVTVGNEVQLRGDGSTEPGVDTIILYRTAVGGSTFLYLDEIPNPAPGVQWTYTDTKPDSALNPLIQAQRAGEGTPLPAGATALGYHLGRIFAAVGNVVWISSGPDATVAGSSGNAGFDTTFTAQSKITRFWTCPLGMVVFTVRDAYIILGSATDSDPLYMVVFIENLPLRSYDCFTINKTTPYLLMGNNTLLALDPSAGITEVGFAIADRLLEEFDSGASFVTFHQQSSLDTALYVANGVDHWYRMAATNAPEVGSAWSPRAMFATLGCVQSVEVAPGQYSLLMSGTVPGPILQRDRSKRTDNGQTYAAMTRFGAIVLALPGQLAALSFITLESVRLGTRPTLALLLGELTGTFEVLKRTRQDPPNLPPSDSLLSDRYHVEQNQNPVWCRHFQMEISWPQEDAANELLTFTIFGQTWQEMRAQ